MRKLAIGLLSTFLLVSNPNLQKSSEPYMVGNFSTEEKQLIEKTLQDAEIRYPDGIKNVFLKADMGEDTFGRTFYADDSKFEEEYGSELAQKVKGSNVLVFEDIERCRNGGLWESNYLKNPSKQERYKRAVLHERGHLVFKKVGTQELEEKLYAIDLEDWQEKQGEHVGHPSYYTYLYHGFGSAGLDKDFERLNAEETFADTYALLVMNKLENVQDEKFKRKIDLVKQVLAQYKK